DHQLLQIAAIAQFFIGHDAEPEIVRGRIRFPGFSKHSWIEHVRFLSNARAKGALLPTIQNPKWKWGGRRDSNPQQPESQSGALPLSYGHQQSLDFSFSRADCKEKARETGTADALR